MLIPFTLLVIFGTLNGKTRPHLILCLALHYVNFFVHTYLGGSYWMSWVITVTEAIVAMMLVNFAMFFYALPTGPYGVGKRETTLKGETTPEVTIFYPIDKKIFTVEKSKKEKISPFLPHGNLDIEGL